MSALTLELPKNITLRVSQEEFEAIAAVNRDLQLERTANGELIVAPPTGSESSNRNLSISIQLGIWAETNESLGCCFRVFWRLPTPQWCHSRT